MSSPFAQRWAYRLFSPLASWTIHDPHAMALSLQRADIPRRPEMHLALYYAAIAGAIILTLALVVLWAILAAPLAVIVLTFTLGLLAIGGLYGAAFHGPRIQAFMRAERLEEQLPYAVNYMASMAQADVTPEHLFENLSRQPVYGEMTTEAQRIRRDLHGLGFDLVEALQRAAARAPSEEFRDFLQGMLTAVSAGGSMETYLRTRAEQYMDDLQQDQDAFLDSLGILAESYVTVVVAGPLFVIIMLTVLVLFGTEGQMPLELGYVMMLAIIPMANVGFAVAIDTISP